MLTIFCDSDSDLTLKEANELGIKMISMPYIVDGKAIYPYRDFLEFEGKEFYDMLRKGVVPSTCAINMDEYINYFEPEFANGNDILYIHLSKAMTATLDYMNQALEELKTKYPERKFYQIDTMAITIGENIALKEIVKFYNSCKDIDKTMEFANNEVLHFATYFFADDLKFFKKSGRVSGLASFMGDLVGIKPIICMDENGIMKSVGKEKGRKKAMQKLLDCVLNLGDNVKDYKVIVGHTDYLDLAKEFGEELNSKFDNKLDIDYVIVNPTAGSHCGPNGIGVSFHAIHR